jgi:hypothetical protein
VSRQSLDLAASRRIGRKRPFCVYIARLPGLVRSLTTWLAVVGIHRGTGYLVLVVYPTRSNLSPAQGGV